MIVLDTNVMVAALRSQSGASNALLRRVLTGEIVAAVSIALFLEYEDVLKRREIASISWATAEEIDAILDAVALKAKLIAPIWFSARPMLADPGDEMVLECAIQAGAEAIVTMNTSDFADLTPWPGLDVLTPGAFLKRLKTERP